MTLTPAEDALYRALNTVLEPMVRAGIGSPCAFSPAGLIVLEVRGRKTGLPRRVPLFAMTAGEHVVAATVRVGTSQWLRNVRRSPHVRYWLGGRVHDAHAWVVTPEGEAPAPEAGDTRQLADALMPAATALRAAFVVLAADGAA